MPAVNIPGVGTVNFPDTMSIDQINRAIETEILPQFRGQQAPARTAESVGRNWLDRNIFDPLERGYQSVATGVDEIRGANPDSFYGRSPEDTAASIARRQRRLEEIPRTEESQAAMRRAAEADGILGAVGQIARSSDAVTDIATESIGANPLAGGVAVAANLATGVPLIRVALGALAGALGFPTEFAASRGDALLDAARDAGIDPRDPQALGGLIREINADPERREAIRRDALTRAGIIASTDAVAGGFAGRIARTRGAIPRVGGAAAVEGVGGGVGEAAAQLATTGELNQTEIAAEIVGGGAMGAAGNITRATDPREAERAQRGAEEERLRQALVERQAALPPEPRGFDADAEGAREFLRSRLTDPQSPTRDRPAIRPEIDTLSDEVAIQRANTLLDRITRQEAQTRELDDLATRLRPETLQSFLLDQNMVENITPQNVASALETPRVPQVARALAAEARRPDGLLTFDRDTRSYSLRVRPPAYQNPEQRQQAEQAFREAALTQDTGYVPANLAAEIPLQREVQQQERQRADAEEAFRLADLQRQSGRNVAETAASIPLARDLPYAGPRQAEAEEAFRIADVQRQAGRDVAATAADIPLARDLPYAGQRQADAEAAFRQADLQRQTGVRPDEAAAEVPTQRDVVQGDRQRAATQQAFDIAARQAARGTQDPRAGAAARRGEADLAPIPIVTINGEPTPVAPVGYAMVPSVNEDGDEVLVERPFVAPIDPRTGQLVEDAEPIELTDDLRDSATVALYPRPGVSPRGMQDTLEAARTARASGRAGTLTEATNQAAATARVGQNADVPAGPGEPEIVGSEVERVAGQAVEQRETFIPTGGDPAYGTQGRAPDFKTPQAREGAAPDRNAQRILDAGLQEAREQGPAPLIDDFVPENAFLPRRPQFSALDTDQQPTAQPAPEAAPETERSSRANAIINERLERLKAMGKQGRLAANAVEAVLKDRTFTPDQIVMAFRIADGFVRWAGSNKAVQIQFSKNLEDMKDQAGGVEPQALIESIKNGPNGVEAVARFSLSDSALPAVGMTSPHEAFHLLQALFKGSEPKLARILGRAFPEGKTLDSIDPTILRKLKTLRPPNSKGSYYDFLKTAIPNEKRSTELQAYVFGALVDAQMRGEPMTGMTPAIIRLVNFFARMKRQTGALLRGDGVTAASIMERAGRGEYGRLDRVAEGSGRQFMMAGERGAQNADRGGLSIAKTLKAQGKSNAEIQSNTGWFKGPDDKWRYEIFDFPSRLTPEALRAIKGERNTTMRLDEALDHPELYKAYPELRATSVEFNREKLGRLGDGGRGSFSPDLLGEGAGAITIDPTISPENIRSVLLHEVQHAVQYEEGFTKGGNPMFMWGDKYRAGTAKLYDRLVEERLSKPISLKEYSRQAWGGEMSPEVQRGHREYLKGHKEALREARAMRGMASRLLQEEAAKIRYRQLGGEVEARVVQRRADIDPSGPRRSPIQDYDEVGAQFSALDPAALRQFSAATGSSPSFVQKVTGVEIDKPSVLTRALRAFVGAQDTALYGGERRAEKLSDAFVRNAVNRAHPFYLLERLLASKGNLSFKDLGRIVESSLNHSGRVEAMVLFGPPTYDPKTGNPGVKADVPGLLEIYNGRVKDADKKEAQAYFIALRERDLRKKGRKGFIDIPDAEIAAEISKAEAAHPEWKEAAALQQKFNEALLEFGVNTGTLTRAKADELAQLFYTPFYRQMETDGETNPEQVIGPTASDTLNNPRAFNIALKGGKQPIGDLYENLIRNADSIVRAGMKNVAMQQASKAMEAAGLARKIKPGEKKAGSITLREGGNEVYYQVEDPVLFAAITGLPSQGRNALIDVMARVGSFFRDMITAAPSFMLANLWRGKIVAYVQEGSTLSPFATADGIKQALKGSTALQTIAMQTGFGGLDMGMDPRDAGKKFARKIQRAENAQSLTGQLKNSADVRNWLDGLLRVSEATEMAERIKLFEKLRAEGVDERNAAFQAYQLAPFSRRGMGDGWAGKILSALIPTVPFLNAKIQGLYRMVENEKGDKRVLGTIPRQIALRGSLLTAFSLAAAVLASDDERWDEETPDRKLMYDIFYVGDRTIYLPRAFEFGSIFGAIPVFMYDAIRREDGSDLAKLFASVGTSTFFFNPLPAALAPILSVATNHDFFRGRELETKGQQALPAQERVNSNTSSLARVAASIVNNTLGELPRGARVEMSPIQAQALLDGYLGTTGTQMLVLADSLLAAGGVIPSKPSGAFGDPSGPIAIAAQALGVRRFVRSDDERVTRFVGDFYKLKEQADQLARSLSEARAAGDIERVQEIMAESGAAMGARTMLDRTGRRIGEINRLMRNIERDRELDADEKRDRLLGLRDQRNMIAQQGVETARAAGLR